MSSDIIRILSVVMAAGVIAAASFFITRELRRRRQACCCRACHLMDKAPHDPLVKAELDHHFHLWETKPPVTPNRERS